MKSKREVDNIKLKTKQRKLFEENFINKEKLEGNNIYYPIKLEYYKTRDTHNEYGIEIVKTEYRENITEIESEEVFEITKEEMKINDIIHKLKENLVTPITLKEVMEDIIISLI